MKIINIGAGGGRDGISNMLLRDHPLMHTPGLSIWPPVWAWVGGQRDQYVTGEVGVLRELRLSEDAALARLYMVIDYEQTLYMGCQHFRDKGFAREIYRLLETQRGQPIKEIGGLDLSFTL